MTEKIAGGESVGLSRSALTELVEVPGGRFLAIQNDLITENLKRFEAQQRNDMAMVQSLLRPGDRVVDVGAHVGTISIPLARLVGSRGHVHAFEGCATHYHLLRENIALNHLEDRISTRQVIVTERSGRFLINDIEGNSGATFFLRSDLEGETEDTCLRLDDWWADTQQSLPSGSRIDFIKIDVEGMELDVLRSAARLLSSHRPILYIEAIPRLLERSGHSLGALDSFLRALEYHYFFNLGARNSRNDDFMMAKLWKLSERQATCNVLAVHAGSDRYPRRFLGAVTTLLRLLVSDLISRTRR